MKYLITILIIFNCNFVFGARYFAEINPLNNTVKRVIVADNQEWCEKALGGVWIETFIDRQDRNYAGIGDDYLEIHNDFCRPQPYPSWVLNEKRQWEAPVLMPADGKSYTWDENTLSWKLK